MHRIRVRIRREERCFRRVVGALVGGGEGAPAEWSQNWYLPIGSAAEGAAEMEATAAFGRMRASPLHHVAVSFPFTVGRRGMMRIAMLILRALGLVEHEAVIVGRGTELHLVINRVQPDTGAVWLGVSDWRRIGAVLNREAETQGWVERVEQPDRGSGASRRCPRGPARR
jgi:hypothetical protein